MNHPKDIFGQCPCCKWMALQRYDATQILDDEDGTIVETRQYTCINCKNTYNRDKKPRPDKTEADLFEVIERR